VTPQVVANLARGGDTEAARGILQDFVDAASAGGERSWHEHVPWPHAEYIAEAFQKMLTVEPDAAKALGIKTSRAGRRPGAVNYDTVTLAATYWLLRRRGRTYGQAMSAMEPAAGVEASTIRKAARACSNFEDAELFSDQNLVTFALESKTLAMILGLK
jgi:hypothetical protein